MQSVDIWEKFSTIDGDTVDEMENLPMNRISRDDLLTIMDVLIDDWYQQHGHRLLRGKAGVKPTFRDSEVITLRFAMDVVPFPGETQLLGGCAPIIGPCFRSCPIRVRFIGGHRHCACWSKHAAAFGATSWRSPPKLRFSLIPNQTQLSAPNGANDAALVQAAPTIALVSVALCTILAPHSSA